MSLELQAREKIYTRVSDLVRRKHFDPAMNGADWNALASARRDQILRSVSDEEFETKMQELLNELKTSHTGFRHAKSPNVPGRHAISATFMRFNLDGEQRWMFQDVHEGGPAYSAGIRPGDILLQIRNRDLRPPDPPIFPVGEDSQYSIQKPDGKRVTGNLNVPSPRSKKHPVIVPKSVICSQLPEGIGWLKVTMFPGAVGIDLAKALDNAFAHLREGAFPPRKHHRIENLQHPNGLSLRHENLHGAAERPGRSNRVRRMESSTTTVLLLKALLQRPKQVLLPSSFRRSAVMNGFEMILPFLKPIEHLILDDTISEVMVNGPDHVFIERGGFVEEVHGLSLGDKSLMIAVKNIARRLGDDICEAKPILDSRLPDGSRVAAVIPPCSLGGVTLTIRKFNSRHFDTDDLVAAGTLERWLANQLEDYVLGRKNILIAGGTGCGKTTLLNILGKFIPDDERILLIEETSEIHMGQQNLVRFEARQAQNGLPPVTIRDLLKAALRHRPDRIILGEIRGGEAFDLLQLLNTGHSGSLSTVHATSARQALARFTSCVLQSGVDLPYRAIKTNIGHSLNVVVQLERRPGRRFVSEVVEINGYDPDRDEYDFGPVFLSEREPL